MASTRYYPTSEYVVEQIDRVNKRIEELRKQPQTEDVIYKLYQLSHELEGYKAMRGSHDK